MPSIETTDWLAIKGRVDTLAMTPAMPVYEPGAIVAPPKDDVGPAPFILLSDVVNDPDRGGRIDANLHVRSGTLMVAVQWPIARAVTHTQMKEIAGQIAEHFRADTCLTYGPSRLRVTQDATAMQSYVDGAYRVAVVRVFWTSLS